MSWGDLSITLPDFAWLLPLLFTAHWWMPTLSVKNEDTSDALEEIVIELRDIADALQKINTYLERKEDEDAS